MVVWMDGLNKSVVSEAACVDASFDVLALVLAGVDPKNSFRIYWLLLKFKFSIID